VPSVRWIPYNLRAVLNVPVRVEKRTVDVRAARKVNSVAADDTIAVTQLPHLEQMAKRPTTISASVTQKART